MKARVENVITAHDTNHDNQDGRYTIRPESGGVIVAVWRSRGGKGRGCELLENTTSWSDEFVDRLLDNSDLCQGIGEYVVDIDISELWPDVELVEWISTTDVKEFLRRLLCGGQDSDTVNEIACGVFCSEVDGQPHDQFAQAIFERSSDEDGMVLRLEVRVGDGDDPRFLQELRRYAISITPID